MMNTSRRTFLRGAGVTMGLPWLESMAATTAGPPQRFAVLFMGTGISPGRWWAKGAGAGMELGESLAPLEPLKAKINVIDGLFNKFATGQGIHPAMTGNLSSGVPVRTGSIIQGGITMDQVLANRIGLKAAGYKERGQRVSSAGACKTAPGRLGPGAIHF